MEDVANAAHLLNSMLCFNPKTRYSIDEVLRHPFFDEIKEPVANKVDYFEITRAAEVAVCSPAQM